MAQITKIKKDFLGLYVIAGGWIARPFFGTCFNEGDKVKTHHFGGSSNAGVTLNDKQYKFNNYYNNNYEIWTTTGIANFEYIKLLKSKDKKLKENTEWYKNHVKGISFIHEEHNQKFADKIKKNNEY